MAFKSGEVVCIRSGGPAMTISEIKGDDAVCVYFDGELIVRTTVPISCLDKMELISMYDDDDDEPVELKPEDIN